MIKIFKKLWVALLIVLLIPLAVCGRELKTKADENTDYIKSTIMVEADGTITTSIILSASLPETYNVLQKNAFKTELASLLTADLAVKKSDISAKYQIERDENFNPDNEIVFGSSAVLGDNYVGYSIKYSSIDVFAYYNNIQIFYKKGFLLDKSKYVIDNIFNDSYQQGAVIMTVGEKYKNMYLSVCEKGFLLEGQLYSPYYYNDFVTLSKRSKSTADGIVQDENTYSHHIWVSEGLNYTSDGEMVIKLNIIHTGWWYLFGTIIPLTIGGIAVAVVSVRAKNKKNEEKENFTEI